MGEGTGFIVAERAPDPIADVDGTERPRRIRCSGGNDLQQQRNDK
jgi:hypothetical protein